MPLSDYLPVIDDRRFDDLVAEARTRIPRYTPEWTDFNDSDPGFALVQLFAWLGDQLLYRMGRVPELNYLKFLQLVGVELRPRAPAEADITFPVRAGAADPYVEVRARTQVAAPADDEGPVVFETDRRLIAIAAQLDAVQTFDGYAYADVSIENAEARGGFTPFGLQAKPDSALLLGFSYDGGFPARIELSLAVWADTAATAPPAMRCLGGPAPVYSSVGVAWEYWNGRDWHPLKLLKDDTAAFGRSGYVYLQTPAVGEMVRARIGARVDADRYWLRARLTKPGYDRPPRLLAVRTNTVAASQLQTVRDEVLGGSNGRPDQRFTLANRFIASGSLVLEVDEGDGFQPWSQTPDFFGVGNTERVFVLNPTTGDVIFPGLDGHIPVANVARPNDNVVARVYRHGGGARGRLAAGTLTTLLGSVAGIDAGRVGNLFPTVGGGGEETLDEAKARAAHELKSQGRAVTTEDFEMLATAVAPVRRAKAMPLVHPDFPGTAVPGVVTVVIVPEAINDEAMPQPSEGLMQAVCTYLDQRRLLTTEVYVARPTYALVKVEATLIAADDADSAVIKTTAEQALSTFLNPLSGGVRGDGWPFGGDVFYSAVSQRLLVTGVLRIADLVISLNGEAQPACSDVRILPGVLVTSAEHEVSVLYDLEDAE